MLKEEELLEKHLAKRKDILPLMEQLREICKAEKERIGPKFQTSFVVGAFGIWHESEESVGGANLIAGSTGSLLYLLSEVVEIIAERQAEDKQEKHDAIHEVLDILERAIHLSREDRIKLILTTA